MANLGLSNFTQVLTRSKQTFIEGSAVSIVTLLALFYAYEVDIFCATEGGEGLGLEVTAEGVETLQQRRMLEMHGCHHAQGFYYGHALSAAGVRAALGKLG